LPTVLDLENLPAPEHVDGTSLKPLISGRAAKVHDYVFGEETAVEPQYSVRDERYKLIESMRSGRVQCFDNQNDPDEKRDVCADAPQIAAELKRVLDQHIQAMIQEAKSYPDWENNAALAVFEQRDSKSLLSLAPKDQTVEPASSDILLQVNPGWSLSTDHHNCPGLCYWAPPGSGEVSALWRSDTDMIGDYMISIRYGGTGKPDQKLATNADFTVRFKGGSFSFPIDQNLNQGRWDSIGRFHDPISVELTNRADGIVVSGAVRFLRVESADVR
jgi:hypothetical protein